MKRVVFDRLPVRAMRRELQRTARIDDVGRMATAAVAAAVAQVGIGRPTPEGAHRDGVDLVVVMLVDRMGIKGGETRVFDADGPTGLRFTLRAPWSALILDDARVVHESTPIQPLEAHGHRDTLVLTYRASGFQGPGAEPPAAG